MIRTGYHRRAVSISVGAFIGCLALLFAARLEAADRIVLRNLKILTDRTVTRVDDDGVLLDDGTILGWDEVERAKIAGARQTEFDQRLKEVGEPLYRIRQRLAVGDYRGLSEHAEAIYARYADRDSPTAYMVVQSLMWARLAAGRREESLDPYLRSLEYLRRHPGAGTALPGERRANLDLNTGLTTDLLPIWFDNKAAGQSAPLVFAAIGRMRKPRPEAVIIYYATLALSAGQADAANRALAALTDSAPVIKNLREVVEAQRDLRAGSVDAVVQRLSSKCPTFDDISKPVGLYWLGWARTQSSDTAQRQAGLLDLLRIPAIYGPQQPDLAAASLCRAMQTLSELKDLRGSVAVRKELLERYPHTSFAERVAAGAPGAPASDSAANKEKP